MLNRIGELIRVLGHKNACATVVLLPLALLHCGSAAMALQPSTESGWTTYEGWEAGEVDSNVPTPTEVLGHEIGDHFTRHAKIVDYFQALEAASDRVQLIHYGESVQRRPLFIAVITDPSNHDRLDEILAINDRLARAERVSTADLDRQPSIAWFSYSVHGNEASTPEGAMLTAYRLAAGTAPEVTEIMQDAVIVIDPCLNPDGRMRYVSFYENVVGAGADRSVHAAEHNEPWPTGRTNHYHFDLNRDWIWTTQAESRQRLPVYTRFRPHVHIDHHEQGYTNPFFMGAGDTPYNANIPAATKDWIDRFGKGNASVFDAAGRVYSQAERFDYLYPGYGKVLPVYHGAVGMLVEQAGHGFAGLAIELDRRRTLTLAHRAANQYLVSMSNAQMTARWREGQLDRFASFFRDAASDPNPLNVYIPVDERNDPAMLRELAIWAAIHHVEIRALGGGSALRDAGTYDARDKAERVELAAGTWVITSRQPMGNLVRTMLERSPFVEDPDTYDITAWSLPVSFGLTAYTTEGAMLDAPETVNLEQSSLIPSGAFAGEGEYALMIDSASHDFVRAIAMATTHEMSVRISGEAIESPDGSVFAAGSLIVHLSQNEPETVEAFTEAVLALGLDVHRVSTGLTNAGPVLGANANEDLDHPKVALLRGSPLSSNAFGQTRHALEQRAQVPHTVVNIDRARGTTLDAFATIVVPDGGAPRAIASNLEGWIRAGGTLVAIGANATWAESAIVGIDASDEDDTDDPDDERPDPSELTRRARDARDVDDRIAGVQMLLDVDTSHPLAAGANLWPSARDGDEWGSMGVIKRGSRQLRTQESTQVVAWYADAPRIGGVLSERNAEALGGTPAVTVHRVGRGRVICLADDPTFRGFQHAPMRLLFNAVLLGATGG